MRYALLGLCLVLGSICLRARAQVIQTTAGVDADIGVQSNPYLDPLLGEWDPTSDPPFAAVTPIGVLGWTSPRWNVQAYARARLYPRRTDIPLAAFWQTGAQVRRQVTDRWQVGVSSGYQQYSLNARRNTAWFIPSVQWTPRRYTTITARVGASRRWVKTFDPVQKQTSVLATVSGQSWLTDRLRASLQLYMSDGQSSTSSLTYGGTGATGGLRYDLTETVSTRVRLTVEQLTSDATTTSRQRDLITRSDIAVEWQVQPRLTAFGEVQGLAGSIAGEGRTDGRIATGLRLRWNRNLYDGTQSPAGQQFCQRTERGIQFRIRSEHDGQLFITGEFNGWDMPGVPLSPVRGEDDLYRVIVPVSMSRFEYRIHHKPTDSGPNDPPQWIDLPTSVPATQDAFGGENALCVVPS